MFRSSIRVRCDAMTRALLALLLFASSVHADDAVALLPLDASAKLDVYGQVVASEISKVLQAGQIEVVVVGPKMSVPQHTKVVVGGKLSPAKGGAIDLTIHIRLLEQEKPFKSFEAKAANLEALPKTTAELAQRVLPVVRDKLAELNKPVLVVDPPVMPPIKPVVEPVKPQPKPILVGIGGKNPELSGALTEAVPSWVAQHDRTASIIELGSLGPKMATKTVAGSNADRAIAFEVLSYSLWGETVPMGKARVRVRIADAGLVLFDRVVVTDTIIGDKAMSKEAFVTRVANEVLEVLRPHVRRTVPGWL